MKMEGFRKDIKPCLAKFATRDGMQSMLKPMMPWCLGTLPTYSRLPLNSLLPGISMMSTCTEFEHWTLLVWN